MSKAMVIACIDRTIVRNQLIEIKLERFFVVCANVNVANGMTHEIVCRRVCEIRGAQQWDSKMTLSPNRTNLFVWIPFDVTPHTYWMSAKNIFIRLNFAATNNIPIALKQSKRNHIPIEYGHNYVCSMCQNKNRKYSKIRNKCFPSKGKLLAHTLLES